MSVAVLPCHDGCAFAHSVDVIVQVDTAARSAKERDIAMPLWVYLIFLVLALSYQGYRTYAEKTAIKRREEELSASRFEREE